MKDDSMKTNFEQVKEFHEVFLGSDPNIPTDISYDEKRLRISLLVEELKEFCVELGFELKVTLLPVVENKSVDMSNVAKELADILYVAYGAGSKFGVDMDAVFKEVHRSNMTKLDNDGKPIFRSDGKIIKSDNYQAANIDRVLDDQVKEGLKYGTRA
jgi:predicted HAD superfamily Cof-like phosphohydrolase